MGPRTPSTKYLQKLPKLGLSLSRTRLQDRFCVGWVGGWECAGAGRQLHGNPATERQRTMGIPQFMLGIKTKGQAS